MQPSNREGPAEPATPLQPAEAKELATEETERTEIESLEPLVSSLRVLIEQTDTLLMVAEDCGILTQGSQDDVHDWLGQAEDALESNDRGRVRDNVTLMATVLVSVQESLQGSECE